MRENWISNRIFAAYSDILDHCCEAWNKLTDRPWLIMSIGLRVHISAQTACDFGLIRPPVSGQFAQRFRRFRHPFRSNPPQLWVEGRGV
jgi:hypothetical protein